MASDYDTAVQKWGGDAGAKAFVDQLMSTRATIDKTLAGSKAIDEFNAANKVARKKKRRRGNGQQVIK